MTKQQIDDIWAALAISAMMERIKSVCIWELEQRVKELRQAGLRLS